MEKSGATKSKNKIMKFLPRASSAVTFQNPSFSPGREKRSELRASKYKANAGRGFSGPIISMIPAEARRKSKNEISFDTQEPTSPKVSCMGQIKHKKRLHKIKRAESQSKERKPVSSSKEVKKQTLTKEVKKQTPMKEEKKQKSFRDIFRGAKPGRKSAASAADKPPLPDRAPSLSQMKQFASGRDTFANFDWTAQIAPVDSDHRDFYSDEESGESEGEEEEVIIPFSAPILVGGGGVALEPRKEVNLWKRRTMDPPRPLQVRSN